MLRVGSAEEGKAVTTQTVKPLNYAIVGAGMMGQEHIRNIILLDAVAVTILVEPDAEMRAKAQALVPQAVAYASLDEALSSGQPVDAYVVVSPNHLHVGHLKQLVASGPVPILLEKPVYTDPADAVVLAQIARSHPAPIWVAMEYRYMPPVAALLAEAQQVTGGIRMLSIREHRFPFLQKVGDWNRFNTQSGGTLVEKCCHFFDLMRLALGDDPVRVMASGGQAVNHLDERVDGRTPDIWDHAYVVIDFAKGARAMLELCMFAEGSRYQEEICATGPNAKIEALVPGPARFWNDAAGPLPIPQLVTSPRDGSGVVSRALPVDPTLLAAGDHNGSTYYQHSRFAALIRAGQGAPEVTLRDGMWAVAMGKAAQIAAAEGRVVAMTEVMSEA